jgi:hypothetical protein
MSQPSSFNVNVALWVLMASDLHKYAETDGKLIKKY